MLNMVERRRHKRIDKQYTTKFRVRSDETRDIGSDDWGPVILRNLSAGGALFFHNEDLGIGTLMDLKIYVPKTIRIINCVGEITRCDKPSPDSMFCCAIKFINIAEQEKEMINMTIVEVLAYENDLDSLEKINRDIMRFKNILDDIRDFNKLREVV